MVEIFTVQALPDPPRAAAMAAIRSLVAPGGTLLTIAFRYVDGDDPDAGPPFPLTRSTMDALAGDELTSCGPRSWTGLAGGWSTPADLPAFRARR